MIKLFCKANSAHLLITNGKGGVNLISEFIKPSYIQLNVATEEWEDAIKVSCKPLIDDKTIDSSYVDGIIKSAKEFGPYFVIAEGVALPHCSNDNNVYRDALSIVTLKKPVRFGHELNDPVKYIFTLAPKETDSHINGLAELANLLSINEFYNILDNSTNPQEVYDYILKKEGN